MRRLIVASTRKGAGKTSVVVGLGKAAGRKMGYLKPFGDRLLYRKKRLWDYDAALIANVFKLEDNPEDMSLGFDHSKLRFMYDEAGTREKLREMLAKVETGKELVLIEAGREISYGASVHLDALSLARHTGAALIVVLSGEEGEILDDAVFVRRRMDTSGVELAGVIVNKAHDPEEFKTAYGAALAGLSLPLLGILPRSEELTHLSVGFLAESLFAKVIAGEGGLRRVVGGIFVGAMSADAAMRNPVFAKRDKLVITSGDRSDMILAALEGDSAAILLSNNILPPANLISLAGERNVPLLLAAEDTFAVAKQVDDLELLLTRDDETKIGLLAGLAKEHLDLKAILG
jgi:uncharacterized protein